MMEGQLWRQYVIAGLANLGSVASGFAGGSTATINVKLGNVSESPLGAIVSENEKSWIGSLATIGAIFGPFVGGFAASTIGRKWGLISSSLPLVIGWIMIAVPTNLAMIYVGRIFFGVSVGMHFTLMPLYCAEIATDDARGALGSFLQLFVTFGYLLGYGIGPFVSYVAIAYVGVALIVLFDICMFFMPETPTYCLTKSNRESAAVCLATLRGKSVTGVEAELDKLATDVAAAQAKTASYKDLLEHGNFKAMYITCALLFFQQFSGVNAILFYMTDIFETAGSNLDPAIATIIVGAVQFGASFITPIFVDRSGRRILLLISSFGTSVAVGVLGMYFLLQNLGSPVVESISIIPLLSLIVFIVTYCMGLGSLPWAIMGELFPIEVKARATPIVTSCSWIFAFIVTKFLADVEAYIRFFVFSVCCVVSFFFTLFIVPETKGKSFQEIQDLLRGSKTSKPEKS